LAFFDAMLASLRRFARGFAGLVVAVPIIDEPLFAKYRAADVAVMGFDEEPGKGMLHHEVIVCSADKYVPHDWDLVFHIDADHLLFTAVTPETYMVDGKPQLWGEKFENFRKSYGTRYGWRKCVTDATGLEPEYETMCRLPCGIHWRWVYPEVRRAVEMHTAQGFKQYVLSCRNQFPQTFAEFPTIGAWVLAHCPERYHFVDVQHPDARVSPHGTLLSFWSHGGLDKVSDDDWYYGEGQSMKGKTPRQVIAEILPDYEPCQ
jgi:hypothetical protein